VATIPSPAGILKTSTDSVVVISTPAAIPPFSPATEADLFAVAGSRPAALRRHRDGTGQWVWLDQQAHPR
jgi:hypothetical protein